MKVQLNKFKKGFTLIELMVTVAIIGILSSIALPTYQDYLVKTSIASAIAEMYPGKTTFEIKINEGITVSTPNDIGLRSPSGVCTNVVVVGGSDGSIDCTVKVRSNDEHIMFTRNSTTGLWACASTAENKYSPKECPGV
jgi:type IV pilus assembly protein PilA